MVAALHCNCRRDSLLLRATVVGGNVPYFLGGVEQKKKPAITEERGSQKGILGFEELWHHEEYNKDIELFSKHISHQAFLGPF